MNFTEEILPCLNNNELCILKLKHFGLLARDIKCIHCNRDLLWTKHKKTKDGFAWKCQNTKCKNHKSARKRARASKLGFWHRRYKLTTRCWVHGNCRKKMRKIFCQLLRQLIENQ